MDSLKPERYPMLKLGIDLALVEHSAGRTARARPPGLDTEPGQVNFAFAGLLCRDKGIHVLLDAFGDLIKQHPGCRLTEIGQSAVAQDK